MSFIEQFGQRKQEDEQVERAEREPKRISLAQILADEKESKLFSAYLEQGDTEDNEDKKSLGKKLFKGEELSETDVDALYEETGKFFATKERADKIRQNLEENKEAIIHASPELRKIVELVGSEVVDAALLERFEEIAITHPEVLASLEDGFAKFSKAGESIEIGNERIDAYCKEYGFTEDEYLDALRRREDDPYALEDLVKSKMGVWKKIKGKFGSYEDFMNNVNDDLDRRDYVKEKLAVADESLTEMGGILRKTLFQNKEAKQILEANLEHKEGPSEKMTFFEARGLLVAPRDEKEMKEDWAEYQKEHSGATDYNVDVARTNFAKEYASNKMPKKKSGFWATIFRTIFSASIEQKLK
jgi:hypothetical protein